MKTASNSRVLRTITLLITIFSLSFPVYAQYSGGTGEPNDPYQIATAEDLMLLGDSPEDYDKHFILTADIDLDPNLPGRRVFDRAVIAPDTNDVEGGYQGVPFTGVFDGNIHTVLHLMVIGGSYLGLFGRLDDGAKVSNVDVEAIDVDGTGDHVGGLAGWNSGTVSNCYSTSTVSGNERVGGLVGGNGGSITNCCSAGTVCGVSDVGGLVGSNSREGSITMSDSTATVTGDRFAGGLAGSNWGSITSSYSTGSVSGNRDVGGLVGLNISYGLITSSYSTGSVSGNDDVGGLVGYNRTGSITASYSTGSVSGNDDVGGLVGVSHGWVVSPCFWDIQTSGQTTSAGGVGLTTMELMDPNMLGLLGFANDPNWVLDAGRDYPRLAWEGTAGQIIPEPTIDWLNGGGTDEAPYEIDSADQLILLSKVLLDKASFLSDKCFVLTNHLDLSGQTWYQAAIPYFEGRFDGNGYVINNLAIQGEGYLGLFGHLGSGAEVLNLGLEAVDVNGVRGSVAGLVGYNEGSIANCHTSGTVIGDGGLVGTNNGIINNCHTSGTVIGGGGLVGVNGGNITNCCSTSTVCGGWGVGGLVGHNSGNITTCYNTGSVSGIVYVSGLVGVNNGGTVSNSYSTGTVSGDSYVGGLVGHNIGNASIIASYSTGAVTGNEDVGGLVGSNSGSITEESFWDIETSGQSTSAGGTGKTTAEMQTASTFLEAGWDFVGETANGTDDIWWILEGEDYPRLWWELLGNDQTDPVDSQ